MLTLELKPDSAVELATHVIPQFCTFTFLIRTNPDFTELLRIEDFATLNLRWPDAQKKSESIEVTVVFQFEIKELKDWIGVSVGAEQRALIHRLGYLCRNHTGEYGKLFHRLINDFCY